MLLYILPRKVVSNFKQLTKQLHMSVKLLSANDSSNSDSDSDSYNNKQNEENKNNRSQDKNFFKILNKLIKTTEKPQKKTESRITFLKEKLPKQSPENFNLDKKLELAVKAISKTVEKDIQNLESELLTNIKLMKTVQTKKTNMPEKSFRFTSSQKVPLHTAYTFLDDLSNSDKNELLPQLSTWNKIEERNLQLRNAIIPQNAFQEMIHWTETGKLWHFPINNEQGIEEEKNVHFSEHIFLERHLKGWCPLRGPLRHFMELVCVGLSKNAFMTVEEKINHITWYKNYFEDKKDLLTKLNLYDTTDAVSPKNASDIK